MVDLPNYSVLVAGLEFWSAGGETISEPRLSRKLARVLEVNSVELRTHRRRRTTIRGPRRPVSPASSFRSGSSLKVWKSQRGPSIRTRLLVHRKALTKGKYIDRDKKKKTVVPVRFVRACRAGHIADIDWYCFAHNGPYPTARNKVGNCSLMSGAPAAI